MTQAAILARINFTAQKCLARCYEAKDPNAYLSKFCNRLRADPEWKERDVLAVDSAVRGMLDLIVTADNYN